MCVQIHFAPVFSTTWKPSTSLACASHNVYTSFLTVSSSSSSPSDSVSVSVSSAPESVSGSVGICRREGCTSGGRVQGYSGRGGLWLLGQARGSSTSAISRTLATSKIWIEKLFPETLLVVFVRNDDQIGFFHHSLVLTTLLFFFSAMTPSSLSAGLVVEGKHDCDCVSCRVGGSLRNKYSRVELLKVRKSSVVQDVHAQKKNMKAFRGGGTPSLHVRRGLQIQ